LTFRPESSRLFPVMRPETRDNIAKQGTEIASVRGTLQALAESWGNDYEHVKYLQKRISDMEEKLTNVQNTLAEIEYSEQVDWTGRLNE
jgi:hypothetical protein